MIAVVPYCIEASFLLIYFLGTYLISIEIKFFGLGFVVYY
jgi:hypothetical protein